MKALVYFRLRGLPGTVVYIDGGDAMPRTNPVTYNLTPLKLRLLLGVTQGVMKDS